MLKDVSSQDEDIESYNRSKRLVVIWFDILYTWFFVIYLTIFKIWTDRAIRRLYKKRTTVARYTLVFSGFKNSDNLQESDIREYFQNHKFGEIIEVTFA